MTYHLHSVFGMSQHGGTEVFLGTYTMHSSRLLGTEDLLKSMAIKLSMREGTIYYCVIRCNSFYRMRC